MRDQKQEQEYLQIINSLREEIEAKEWEIIECNRQTIEKEKVFQKLLNDQQTEFLEGNQAKLFRAIEYIGNISRLINKQCKWLENSQKLLAKYLENTEGLAHDEDEMRILKITLENQRDLIKNQGVYVNDLMSLLKKAGV